MARRPSPRARVDRGTGLPPAFVAIAVLLAAAVGVLFVVSRMQPPREEEAPRVKTDPFADMPPEEPPGGRKLAAGAEPQAGADRSGPFADLSSLQEEALWKEARALGDAGMDLLGEASRAKQAGDQAGFKTLGKQAQEKLEQALDATRDWEHALVAEHGATHPDVRSIQRTRTIWRNQLVALKKTVGL